MVKNKFLSLLLFFTSSFITAHELLTLLEDQVAKKQLLKDDFGHYGVDEESMQAKYYIEALILMYPGLSPSSKAKGSLIVNLPDSLEYPYGHEEVFDIYQEQEAIDYLMQKVKSLQGRNKSV